MDTKRILVIAGSDSSGGAGLEADQKVIAAHGCYAMTATTALTAQNTLGVYGIHSIPPEFVAKQIDACVEDIGVDVVKTGMLAGASTIKIVAEAIERHELKKTVIDPVMIATSGAQLLPEEAVESLHKDLLPKTMVLTPNIPEALLLIRRAELGFDNPETVDDIVRIAQAVRQLGPQYVVLKGGHIPLTKERVVSRSEAERHTILNVLCGPHETIIMESKYQNSKNTHGTGCSLASAIASNLAAELSVEAAVRRANQYVEAGIRLSKNIGKGSGPINHFHSTYTLPFAPGRFVEYMLERKDVNGPWREHTEHEFVQKLAKGTLPLEKFKNYLVQDYKFLIHFSRTYALAAYKSKSLSDIRENAQHVIRLQDEMKLHIDFCAKFGLSQEDIEREEESEACTAYTRYVLDIGHSEDSLALQIAVLPCMVGYSYIAKRLYTDPESVRDGNMFWHWVETYAGDDYNEGVKKAVDLVEKYAVTQSASRIDELAWIFIQATRMETGFWDMGSQGKGT